MWRSKRTTPNVMSDEPSPTEHESTYRSQQCGGEHNDETEDSQPDHEQPKSVPWNENISILEDDVLETVDSDGNIGIKRGQVHVSQVWLLETLKYVVKFNKYKQPVGKGGHLLVRFLGEVAKRNALCPIGETSWHYVHKSYKLDILRLTQSKFHIPNDMEIDEMVLSHVNGIWKMYRSQLKARYLDPNKTEEQIASQVPKNIIREQWVRLVRYWFSTKGKTLSAIGKRAHAQKADSHTTGSKSFAQKKFEFATKKNREPSNLEVWKMTHQRKDGTYIKDTNTKEFMETAKKLVDERVIENPEMPRTSIEDAVFNQLMYDEEVSNQRVVGYGHGVSRSQVFGLKADLRKSGCVDDLIDVKGKLNSIEKENEQLKKGHVLLEKENEQLKNVHASLQSQLRCITSALARNGIVLSGPNGREHSERNMHDEEVIAHASSGHRMRDGM